MTAKSVDPRLAPLELATGLVFGGERRWMPRSPAVATPLEALRSAVLPSLARPPCLVSFSGGRDSSSVLAAATLFARQEGLPLPIPATNRFAAAPSTNETEWQEMVVAHVGLSDWLRLDLTDELDAVGPYATRALRRHGLLWPFNAHFHAPLLDAARGGSLLTGIGGDEVFGTSSWARVNDVLARRVTPEPRDALRIAAALSPPPLRRRALAARAPKGLPWLRPAAERGLAFAWADHVAAEPRRYAERLAWWRSRRWAQLNLRSMELLARDARAGIAHPLMDEAFGAAIAQATRRDGPADRGAFMAKIFGDLLPVGVYHRATKASFDAAFWGRHARRLVSQWSGEAADPELIDMDELRAHWASPRPDAHSFTLLQAAWLELERSQQAANRRPPATDPSHAAGRAPTPAAPRV